jgi:hypothetical protein
MLDGRFAHKGEKMKRVSILILLVPIIMIFSGTQGQDNKGNGKRMEFNRISLIIPTSWNYSKNPNEKYDTDQLQLFSNDRNRTLLITLTKNRPELDFVEAEHSGRFEMLRRALTIPGFETCSYTGTSQDEQIWGRRGIFSRFDLYENETKKPNERKMIIYNYGEQLVETDEVLFITAFIIGEENIDTNNIVKSLEIIKK